MTFDPRSKARKAAMELRAAYAMTPAAADAIESALLAFAREVLTQEPDEGMRIAGYEAACLDEDDISEIAIWNAMSAHRAKSLEDA